MSQESIDAVRDIEREKGIESGTLVAALEDALLAAYKKMPGSSRHATVEIDDQGDLRVVAVQLPADREARPIEERRTWTRCCAARNRQKGSAPSREAESRPG